MKVKFENFFKKLKIIKRDICVKFFILFSMIEAWNEG